MQLAFVCGNSARESKGSEGGRKGICSQIDEYRNLTFGCRRPACGGPLSAGDGPQCPDW